MHQTDLEIKLKTVGPLHVEVAKTYNNIGIVLEKQGKFSEALEAYENSLRIKRLSLGDSHVNSASTHVNIGAVYEKLGDYEKALFHFNKAHDIFVRSLGPDHHNTQQAARALERLQPALYGGQAAGEVHSLSQERRLSTRQPKCCGVQ